MKTAINAMGVVAGIALLGRSGDMSPTLQRKARVGVILIVRGMGVSGGGVDSSLAPPLSRTVSCAPNHTYAMTVPVEADVTTCTQKGG